MLLGGAFRGAARCVTRRARPRALFDDQGEQCLNQSVCVRAGLAAGDAPRAAIEGAKVYLDAALRASASLNIGRGAHGPLHHGFRHNAWPA